MKRLDFYFWLLKKSVSKSFPHSPESARHILRASARREIHSRLRDDSFRGKGNRAWKRVAQIDKNWREQGGFYLSDLIP